MTRSPSSLFDHLHAANSGPAWEEFVARVTPFVVFWAKRTGLRAADAADVAQEVFLTVVKQLPTFRRDKNRSLSAWLHSVTLNKCRDRHRRAAPSIASSRLLEKGAARLDESATRREHNAELSARALAIMRTDFAETTWQACWQSVAEGRPAATIAGDLGISTQAVYAATFRVLARLREQLAAEGLVP